MRPSLSQCQLALLSIGLLASRGHKCSKSPASKLHMDRATSHTCNTESIIWIYMDAKETIWHKNHHFFPKINTKRPNPGDQGVHKTCWILCFAGKIAWRGTRIVYPLIAWILMMGVFGFWKFYAWFLFFIPMNYSEVATAPELPCPVSPAQTLGLLRGPPDFLIVNTGMATWSLYFFNQQHFVSNFKSNRNHSQHYPVGRRGQTKGGNPGHTRRG